MSIYVEKDGKQSGPFEEEQVKSDLENGIISPEALAWKAGMTGWQPLRSFFAEAQITPPPLPVLPPIYAHSQPPPARERRMGDDAGMRLLLPVGRSGWAIAAGYLGLISLVVLPAPLALIISLVAIRDINKSADSPHPKHGMGRAIFGLIMGMLGTGLLAFLLIKSKLQ